MSQPRPTSQISKNQTCKIVLDCPVGTLIDLVDERDCPLPNQTCHLAISGEQVQTMKTNGNGRVVLRNDVLRAGQTCVVSFPELDGQHLHPDTSHSLSTVTAQGYACRSGEHYRFRYNTRTKVYMGLFFDGTGNNMHVDEGLRRMSNVACLYRMFNGDKTRNYIARYINGVGTQLPSTDCNILVSPMECWDALRDTSWIGGGFAAGMRNRLNGMLRYVEEIFDLFPSIQFLELALFGFSRGAVAARIFCNWINDHSPAWKKRFAGLDIKIRFLGIFDSVSSIGLAGNNIDIGLDKDVPSNVESVVHFIAAHERRNFFPLQSIRKSSSANLPANWIEIAYPGVHSDVGGGYVLDQKHKDSQGRLPRLASIPLKDMHDLSARHQVPLKPVAIASGMDSVKHYYQTSSTLNDLYGTYKHAIGSDDDLVASIAKHEHWYFRCLASTMAAIPANFDKDSTDSIRAHWETDFKHIKQGFRIVTNPKGQRTRHPVYPDSDAKKRMLWIEDALKNHSTTDKASGNLTSLWELYIHDSVASYRLVDTYMQARRIYYLGESRWIRENDI